MQTIEILGVRVAQLTAAQALEEIERVYVEGRPGAIAYVNAHTLNLAHEQPAFKDVLGRMALVLNDGSGLAWAAKRQRRIFPENLNGTDFTPKILALAAERKWPVFLLGAKAGVAEAAAQALAARIEGLKVAGARDGYFAPSEVETVKASIRASGARVLVVAMGNPLQEHWLDTHLVGTGCRLGVGVGAFLDFAAGAVSRSPVWMQRLGIEWVYRLMREPGRMWRRYIIGNPLFMSRVVAEQRRRGPLG